MPAYFNDSQRQATKDAGKIAGLEVLRIVNEPTAAALAYGLDKKKNETIAVYDFGGGTFDISILEVGEGVVEVKATNGDTHLGGDNLDQRIIDWIVGEFRKQEGIDLSKDRMALQRLKEAAEKAKMELSTVMETDISLPFITADADRAEASRDEADAGEVRVARRGPAAEDRRSVQAGAGRRRRDAPPKIDEVVLVGGSTRIPRVQADRQGAVRQGAAQGREPGRGRGDRRGGAGRRALGRGQGPAAARRDAAVARHRDAGRRDDDAHPRATRRFRRKKSEVFSTAADGQTSVEVHVLQGERPMARDNRTLGKFHLDGIPPAPRGVPQIEVDVRHRRQRHRERPGEGQGHGQGTEDHDHRVERPHRRTRSIG